MLMLEYPTRKQFNLAVSSWQKNLPVNHYIYISVEANNRKEESSQYKHKYTWFTKEDRRMRSSTDISMRSIIHDKAMYVLKSYAGSETWNTRDTLQKGSIWRLSNNGTRYFWKSMPQHLSHLGSRTTMTKLPDSYFCDKYEGPSEISAFSKKHPHSVYYPTI